MMGFQWNVKPSTTQKIAGRDGEGGEQCRHGTPAAAWRADSLLKGNAQEAQELLVGLHGQSWALSH